MPQVANNTKIWMWKVGEQFPEDLPLTPQIISSHLLSDWLPGVPAGQGAAFMGWPSRLLSSQWGRLCLSDLVATTERQWKGMISWMLGVAGARVYLANDNYRWIAPVSAFFQNIVQPVSVPQWYLPFPQPDLTINRVRSRVLCPDYIVARSTAVEIQWAVAEAKGTAKSLTRSTACEPDWSEQVRNIEIHLNGSPLTPQRHMVIATRVNLRGEDRALCIKAWNGQDPKSPDAFAPCVPEVVSAHLFGLYAGLGLSSISRQLAIGVFRRARSKHRVNSLWNELARQAHLAVGMVDSAEGPPPRIELHAGDDSVSVELSDPLRWLTVELSRAELQSHAVKAVQAADRELDGWWARYRGQQTSSVVTLPFGVRVHFPKR